ncbi:ABC transporter permease, partial [candidate division KSB1 bacterium]
MIKDSGRTSSPPKIARRLIGKMIEHSISDNALGDLEEQFRNDLHERGRFRARMNYWLQIKAVFPSFITDLFSRNVSMFLNYLKIALRNIIKHKLYAAINISGLAVGMAVFLLTFIYVRFEQSFDDYHEYADSIFRVIQRQPESPYFGKDKLAVTPAPLAPALISDYPEVLYAARIGYWSEIQFRAGHKRFINEVCYFADREIFEILSFRFIRGDKSNVFPDQHTAVISDKAAERFFGTEDPVGKDLMLKNENDFTGGNDEVYFRITGVFRSMPENSHLRMDIILPLEYFFASILDNSGEWVDNSKFTFIRLAEGADPADFDGKIRNMQERYPIENIPGDIKTEYYLQPIRDIHLNTSLAFDVGSNRPGKYIYIFISTGLLILIMSCINYMNLAAARSVQRYREVGMRKVAGAKRMQLVRQFLGESILLSFISLVIAVFLANALLPVFRNLTGTELDSSLILDPLLITGLPILVLLTGLISGSYPALYISSFLPVNMLKSSGVNNSGNFSLRNILVVFQFAFLTAMIIATLTVNDQLRYIMNFDTGYDIEQIIVIRVKDSNLKENIEAVKSELVKDPDIFAASSSYLLPNSIGTTTVARWPGKPAGDPNIRISFNITDYNYASLYGIEIIEGRDFSREYPSDADGAYLINETAARVLGWDDPVGKELQQWNYKPAKIVGIMKD